MPMTGFKLAMPASGQLQAHATDRAATGNTGSYIYQWQIAHRVCFTVSQSAVIISVTVLNVCPLSGYTEISCICLLKC
jgi:hypothetical protein